MNVQIEESWKQYLQSEFDKPYFAQLTTAVRQEYQTTTCYPPGKLIFNAFNLCPFDKVKVVIIGQDPYHEPGQAHGLSFSVQDGIQFPPSLQNIFKEIQADLGKEKFPVEVPLVKEGLHRSAASGSRCAVQTEEMVPVETYNRQNGTKLDDNRKRLYKGRAFNTQQILCDNHVSC